MKIRLHETDMFRSWMKQKGYKWPEKLIEQENMVAEFSREGFKLATSPPPPADQST